MIAASKRALGGIAAVICAALFLSAPASAARVEVTEELPEYDHVSRLSFVAAPGESNLVRLTVTDEQDGYLTVEVRDEGAPLSAGTGCNGGGGIGRPAFCRLHEVVAHEICAKGCPVPAMGENWRVSVVADLGDEDDWFIAPDLAPKEPVPMLVSGGVGNDWITTATGEDSVDPGDGADMVRTGLGNDLVETTAEPDGPDYYDLGESRGDARDFDRLSYRERTTPLVIAAGAGGADNEGDDLIGVETLIGGSAGDRLVGDGGIRRIEGGDGADVLIGGKAKSRIFGEAGDDLLIGGPRSDELREPQRSGSGSDTARGMGGGDVIVLGDGDDRAFGGRGDDRVQPGPGHDEVTCGPGVLDTVVHPGPDPLRGCEWVIVRR